MQPEQRGPHQRMRDRDDEHEEHPLVHDESNWLVSYADMMTLLFGFFVLMYSFSKIDKDKFEVVRKDMVKYFGGKLVEDPGAPEGIRKLSQEIKTGVGVALGTPLTDDKKKFNVKVEGNNIIVSMASDILFAPGSSRPSAQAMTTINKIYDSIKSKKIELIEVEGHTDSDPISTPTFPSNWELSTSRAASIVRIFENLKVPREQLKASGFANSRPVADDLGVEGELLKENKQKNRRVVLNFKVDPENADLQSTLEAQGLKTVRPEDSPEVKPDSPNATTSSYDLSNLQKLYDETKARLEKTTGRLNETIQTEKRLKEFEKMVLKTEEMERKAETLEKKIEDIKQKNEETLLKTQERLKQNEARP